MKQLKKTNIKNISLYSFYADMKKNKLRLDHKLQRMAGQYSPSQKSVLIDSIIKGYSINPIYVELTDRNLQYVIDGLQRSTTIMDFMENKFSLARNLKPVELEVITQDGEIAYVKFEIAGKRWNKLDEEVKRQIMDFQMVVYYLENFTEEEITEMFIRLNNGVPMNNAQKMVTDIGNELYKHMINALTSDVWGCFGITKRNKVKAADRQIFMQSLYAISDFEQDGFKKAAMTKFLKDVQPESYDERNDLLMELSDRLHNVMEAFGNQLVSYTTEKDRYGQDIKIANVSKITNINNCSISTIFGGAKEISKDKDALDRYAKAVINFFENEYVGSEYSEYCAKGTSDRANVIARIEFFKGIADSVK